MLDAEIQLYRKPKNVLEETQESSSQRLTRLS